MGFIWILKDAGTMIAWIVAILFVLLSLVLSALLIRAAKRLLEFDSVLTLIVDPMEEYGNFLRKITQAEGMLHDHPEVMAFHRANMEMLKKIDNAVAVVKRPRPQKKELPRPEVI